MGTRLTIQETNLLPNTRCISCTRQRRLQKPSPPIINLSFDRQSNSHCSNARQSNGRIRSEDRGRHGGVTVHKEAGGLPARVGVESRRIPIPADSDRAPLSKWPGRVASRHRPAVDQRSTVI